MSHSDRDGKSSRSSHHHHSSSSSSSSQRKHGSSTSSRPSSRSKKSRTSSTGSSSSSSSSSSEMRLEGHSILLAQFTLKPESKQFRDFHTVSEALECLVSMFSSYFLELIEDSNKPYEYDINDFYKFIDQLPDLAILVYDDELKAYDPHDKAWIKRQAELYLVEQAS